MGMVHALHMSETRSAVWGSIWESFLISVGQKVGFGSSGQEGRATQKGEGDSGFVRGHDHFMRGIL